MYWNYISYFKRLNQEQYKALSKKSKSLRNILGYPTLSSFGTFAYCASLHIDKDDSATSGFVMKRPPNVSFSEVLWFSDDDKNQVKRHESNFVFASRALVIELTNQAYWFWNAQDDAHGSTFNDLALRHPRSYRRYVTLEKADNKAQWTRVLVMPHTVVAANLNKEADSWPSSSS